MLYEGWLCLRADGLGPDPRNLGFILSFTDFSRLQVVDQLGPRGFRLVGCVRGRGARGKLSLAVPGAKGSLRLPVSADHRDTTGRLRLTRRRRISVLALARNQTEGKCASVGDPLGGGVDELVSLLHLDLDHPVHS